MQSLPSAANGQGEPTGTIESQEHTTVSTGRDQMDERESEVTLEVYVQAWEQVRHAQHMRATYFNFYLAIVGASITVPVAMFSSTRPWPWEVFGLVGLVVWLAGILTLARIVRLTGLVTHELHTVRQIRSLFRDRYPSLVPALPRRRPSIEGVELDRPLWSRNRTIEPLACVLISSLWIGMAVVAAPVKELSIFNFVVSTGKTGAKVQSYFWTIPKLWVQILLVFLGVLFILWEWRAEVGHQLEKHSQCCGGSRELWCVQCRARTPHYLESAYGWRRYLLGRTAAWACSKCASGMEALETED